MKKSNKSSTIGNVILVFFVLLFIALFSFYGKDLKGKIKPLLTSPIATIKNDLTIKRLEKRLNRVASLNDKLEKKIEEIKTTRHEFKAEIDRNRYLITKKQQEINLSSYEQGLQNQEIKTSLKIIQVRLAHVSQFERVSLLMSQGRFELKYLEDRFYSDLRAIEVIGLEQINALIKEIKTVIDKYEPYLDELDSNEVDDIVPLETIWNDIKNEKRLAEEKLEQEERAKAEAIKKERDEARLEIEAKKKEKEKKKLARQKSFKGTEKDRRFLYNLTVNVIDLDYYLNASKNAFSLNVNESDYHIKKGFFGSTGEAIIVPEKIIFINTSVVIGFVFTTLKDNHRWYFYDSCFNLKDSLGAEFNSSTVVSPAFIIDENTTSSIKVLQMHKGRSARVIVVFQDNSLEFKVLRNARFDFKDSYWLDLILPIDQE